MLLGRILTIILLIFVLALLQNSFISFVGIKPMWIAALVLPLISISGNMGLNIFVIILSTLLLKSEYGLEPEILIFLAGCFILILVKKLWIKNYHILIYGGIVVISASYFLLNGYGFWYEILFTLPIAFIFYNLIKNSGYEKFQ